MKNPTHVALTLEQYQQLGIALTQLPYNRVSAIVPFLEKNAVAYVMQDDNSLIRFAEGAAGGSGPSPSAEAPVPSGSN